MPSILHIYEEIIVIYACYLAINVSTCINSASWDPSNGDEKQRTVKKEISVHNGQLICLQPPPRVAHTSVLDQNALAHKY